MCESPHCHGGISNFSEDFRHTNYGVPLRIDRSTMPHWNTHHMTSFAEKTGHHLLWSVLSTNQFRWIWTVFEDLQGGLLFCFGLIHTDPWYRTIWQMLKKMFVSIGVRKCWKKYVAGASKDVYKILTGDESWNHARVPQKTFTRSSQVTLAWFHDSSPVRIL